MKFINSASFFIVVLMVFSKIVSASAPLEIQIKSLSYAPKEVEITVGQSVIWKNTALTKHSATSNDNGKTFDTEMLAPGKSSQVITFDKAGDYPYHCNLHGKTMSGEISVKADAK
jgi:plastocyanin